MTALTARKLAIFAPAAFWLLSASAAFGQAASPEADKGAVKPTVDDEKLPAYHHSIFSWEHSVTTQTVGVGDSPQSSNPTYTMGFVAKPLYYLVDDKPKGEHFALLLEGGLYREFTNSDVTTRRGEWDFSDTYLACAYTRRFQGPSNTDGTLFSIRPLTLTVPTSKISYRSGRYFAPGAAVAVTNVTPWFRGRGGPQISSLVRLGVGYKRSFARATVPTNPSLDRERLDTIDGHSFASDELSGASLVRDQLEFAARLRLAFGEDVYWTTDAGISPAWKYHLQNQQSVCGVILTGCVPVQGSPNDSRYLVITAFNTELSVRIAKGFSIELGYGNVANQLGLDGRRRSFFYSPGATFYASVSFFPHELVTGSKQLAQNGAATPNL
ncbi:MAG TPA: hypothetical protein VNG33_22115 [Polyangiaceae bacterium]|nr:hypothetical protein [Polyangiaceae bacterium]